MDTTDSIKKPNYMIHLAIWGAIAVFRIFTTSKLAFGLIFTYLIWSGVSYGIATLIYKAKLKKAEEQ